MIDNFEVHFGSNLQTFEAQGRPKNLSTKTGGICKVLASVGISPSIPTPDDHHLQCDQEVVTEYPGFEPVASRSEVNWISFFVTLLTAEKSMLHRFCCV